MRQRKRKRHNERESEGGGDGAGVEVEGTAASLPPLARVTPSRRSLTRALLTRPCSTWGQQPQLRGPSHRGPLSHLPQLAKAAASGPREHHSNQAVGARQPSSHRHAARVLYCACVRVRAFKCACLCLCGSQRGVGGGRDLNGFGATQDISRPPRRVEACK